MSFQGHTTKQQYIDSWLYHTDQLVHLYMSAGDTYEEALKKRDAMRATINTAADNAEADGKFETAK